MSLISALKDYLRSSEAELRKVTWPTKEQTIRYTALVIGASLVLAVFFATVDLGLTKVLDAALTARTSSRTPAVSSDNAVPVEVSSTTPGIEIQPITTPTPSDAAPKK